MEELPANPLLRLEKIEPRRYQEAIASEAVKRNTLVVLPTALGKTLIATYVAAHFLYQYSDRKVLVMAPTRPLVLQHQTTFLRHLKLRPQDIQVLTGKQQQDYRLHSWSGETHLFFATPEVVRNDINADGVPLDKFSLLVFDECHRARKEYAYTEVAKDYVKANPYPMILGLTASPGSSREKIEEICQALHIEHIEARTEEDEDVRPYVNPVKLQWQVVSLPSSYQPFRKVLGEMLDERLRRLAGNGIIKKDPEFIFRRDLIEAQEELLFRMEETGLEEEKGRLAGNLVTASSALSLYHSLELLDSQGPPTLRSFLDRVRDSDTASHRSIVNDPRFPRVLQALQNDSLEEHPKLRHIHETLTNHLTFYPESRVLLFTQYRDTATHLVEKLTEWGYNTARFVGQAAKESDPGLTQEEQLEILQRFRHGELQVLVATSIGEEGLDIPECDLVLFYEPVPSEIRFIQRRGRTGRRGPGRVLILAAHDTLDMTYLRVSQRKAMLMKQVIPALNLELQTLPRGTAPTPRPLAMEIITAAEEYVEPEVEEVGAPPEPEPSPAAVTPPITIIPREESLQEIETLRQRSFRRELRGTTKYILRHVLKNGGKGVWLPELVNSLEADGITPATTQASVKQLVRIHHIVKAGNRLFPEAYSVLHSAKRGDIEYEGLRLRTIEVKKMLPGRALVLVDDQWHAILAPWNYHGPRNLLKKNSVFKATASLYREEGKLHVRIHGIAHVE